jgi:hypothetical protein
MICPKCGSKKIDQYRMMTGPIWCMDCKFEAPAKERDNPFLEEEDKPAVSKTYEQGLAAGIAQGRREAAEAYCEQCSAVCDDWVILSCKHMQAILGDTASKGVDCDPIPPAAPSL